MSSRRFDDNFVVDDSSCNRARLRWLYDGYEACAIAADFWGKNKRNFSTLYVTAVGHELQLHRKTVAIECDFVLRMTSPTSKHINAQYQSFWCMKFEAQHDSILNKGIGGVAEGKRHTVLDGSVEYNPNEQATATLALGWLSVFECVSVWIHIHWKVHTVNMQTQTEEHTNTDTHRHRHRHRHVRCTHSEEVT